MHVPRFAVTLFVSAALLFALQPMVARMIVPLLGGAPAVWIVCSLCFQALLLAGYGYAHVLGSRLPVRVQVLVHLAVVASAFLVMPIAVNEAAARTLSTGNPSLGLIALLLRTVGLPFFVLATTSPLLQRWFAELGETDPYHLYAASNAGSMIALLGYPLAVEPVLGASSQGRAMHGAYVVYAALVVACAVTTARRGRVGGAPPPPAASARGEAPAETPATRLRERATWVALAFAPSSLLLGATEYITTDLASVPLLWVVPLSLYLASFIVAFARRQVVPPGVASRALALLACFVSLTLLAELVRPAWLMVTAHLLLLFVAAVACHQALAARRPRVERLTEFYLLLSLGGVLGGVFNGLVAPSVFGSLIEYPIAIALVCGARLLLPGAEPEAAGARARSVALGLALGAATLALVRVGTAFRVDPRQAFLWMFGAPIFVAFVWSKRPLRFAVALLGILVAGSTYGGVAGETIFRERNFFGVLRVTQDHDARFRLLVYGHTMHGKQSTAPELRGVPLAYYHPTGPAGDVLGPLPERDRAQAAPSPRRVGVIGLGVGALAAYARPGDTWTFFEINPAVVDIARAHFTFLGDAPRDAKIEVEIGDARLRLRDGAAERFDVLVLDAFTSDAIPIHLVTREALAVYRRALAPEGLLLAHVSNRHVKLQPILAALAKEAGMAALDREDVLFDPALARAGKADSEWVVLASSSAALEPVRSAHEGWRPLEPSAASRVWTDDFANVLGAVRF